MPIEPRIDRLSRVELGQLQRFALRSWKESEWLAEHDPRAWVALDEYDPSVICVDLGSGVGESEQQPGYIALDREQGNRRELQARTGEERLPDIVWDLNDGLPFEDQAVDKVCIRHLLRGLSDLASTRLPKELARTLVVGGTVTVTDAAPLVRGIGNALEEHGFQLEELKAEGSHGDLMAGRFVLQRQKRPLEDVQPYRIDEHVLGDLVIREPRQPHRR